MAELSAKNVHQDAVLTNLAIGYHPSGFVAEEILPVVKVQNESDKYYTWNRQEAFYNPNQGWTLRADKTAAHELSFQASTSTYTAEEYALKTAVSDREKGNADSVLRLREAKMRRIQDLLMLDQERRVANLLTTYGNYASGHATTLTDSDQWDDSSGSDTITIESDLDTGKEQVRSAIGMEPTEILFPAAVAKVVKRDSDIRDLIKYTQSDLLVNGDLPPTMFNMNVHIAGTTYTGTAKGADASYSDVWSDYVVMIANGGRANLIDEPSFGKILRARDWKVRTWRDEEIASEYIETSVIQDEKITSSYCGYLIADVLE